MTPRGSKVFQTIYCQQAQMGVLVSCTFGEKFFNLDMKFGSFSEF
jgi:hypothetical protein